MEYGFRTGQGRLHEIGTATFAKQHSVLTEKKRAESGEYDMAMTVRMAVTVVLVGNCNGKAVIFKEKIFFAKNTCWI